MILPFSGMVMKRYIRSEFPIWQILCHHINWFKKFHNTEILKNEKIKAVNVSSFFCMLKLNYWFLKVTLPCNIMNFWKIFKILVHFYLTITHNLKYKKITCGLLNSIAMSCNSTSRFILGAEKSKSDRRFIWSLALADIGRNTGK